VPIKIDYWSTSWWSEFKVSQQASFLIDIMNLK